jgi:hypothetical protein
MTTKGLRISGKNAADLFHDAPVTLVTGGRIRVYCEKSHFDNSVWLETEHVDEHGRTTSMATYLSPNAVKELMDHLTSITESYEQEILYYEI